MSSWVFYEVLSYNDSEFRVSGSNRLVVGGLTSFCPGEIISLADRPLNPGCKAFNLLSPQLGTNPICTLTNIWGFPKIRGRYLFEGPHNKDDSVLVSILGPPILGNYHFLNPTCNTVLPHVHRGVLIC